MARFFVYVDIVDKWCGCFVGCRTVDVEYQSVSLCQGTAVAQWLRRCATNRKVTGSIPDGVIGIFP